MGCLFCGLVGEFVFGIGYYYVERSEYIDVGGIDDGNFGSFGFGKMGDDVRYCEMIWICL